MTSIAKEATPCQQIGGEPWCRDHTHTPYTFDEYIHRTRRFHGYAAPGLILGGKMVSLALDRLDESILFDSVCETAFCLPDAIQMLTLCTMGNGWLKVVPLGRFALSLYDKFNGNGFRVHIDSARINAWPEIKAWFYKLKPKAEQDNDRLHEEMATAGDNLFSVQAIRMQPAFLEKREVGPTADCPICHEAYPVRHGRICRGCQGSAPYRQPRQEPSSPIQDQPPLKVLPLADAVGHRALHDMTRVVPGHAKGAAFVHGQRIAAGDVCRLQQMGRANVYVADDVLKGNGWVHENDAAEAFARVMAGPGVTFKTPPKEGKINFTAADDGLLTIDETRLEAFNLVPNVMCATRKGYSVVKSGRPLGGTRAIPLFLPRTDFEKALAALDEKPVFRVHPLRRARVGVLITGTEVFKGLIKDGFEAIIRAKVEKIGSLVVGSVVVPDQRQAIVDGVQELIAGGADLLVTTAGLSVDPDDVTRLGLLDAGVTDLRFGMPILPGAMTLLARIGAVDVLGVPACALYYRTTALDLLLPRLLAGVPITRQDLARMGHGSFCLSCESCSFPKCAFGK
jgi:formylmethanofuran dehydrogenase subunit E